MNVNNYYYYSGSYSSLSCKLYKLSTCICINPTSANRIQFLEGIRVSFICTAQVKFPMH